MTPPEPDPSVPSAGNRRGRGTRERILAAGDACFEAYGLALTLDQVAEAAGTTRMTVHRHMGGREKLITHLVLRASNRLATECRELLDAPGDPTERLTAALVHTVLTVRATPSLAQLFAGADVAGPWTELDPDERVLGTIHAFYRPYLEAVAQADGLRPGIDAAMAVSWLLAQVLLVLVVPSVAPDRASLERFFGDLAVPAVLT